MAALSAIRYTIGSKTGATSRPVDVTYEMDALARRGYLEGASGMVTLPVFGLYSNYTNGLVIELRFNDGSSRVLPLSIATAPYADANGIYDHPTVLKRRPVGSVLGFDYFAIKALQGTPIVVDTDGEIRWAGIGIDNSAASTFDGNAFVIGAPDSTRISRLELDGSIRVASLTSTNYTNFHHNIDPGKVGLLAEVDSVTGGTANLEAVIAEVTSAGALLHEWDFSSLLSTYMRSKGDDPAAFVRLGIDWFHMNAAVYDPRDDSLIVSSRENFVIKVDYRTGDIVWILGDPTKYWYTFPSLRAKALNLQPGGLYPIGQHAVSMTSDGLLLLFNDGFGSVNQPAGAPTGETRTYSTASAYAIDPSAHTAREAWRFDYAQTIYSDICSSVYESPGRSFLVSYAAANSRTLARLVGLDSNLAVVFDFQYQSPLTCGTSWNAVPIPFEGMHFS